MKTLIPEDLSRFPDVADRPPHAPPAPVIETPPEDLSKFPNAALPSEPAAEDVAAATPAGRFRVRWPLALTLTGVVATLAVLFIAGSLYRYLAESFRLNAVYGTINAVLVALLLTLISIIVGREVRAYLRLRTFDGLRRNYEKLAVQPHDVALCAAARHEVMRFLDHLEEFDDAELLARVRRLRDQLDMADDTPEWKEDIDRILLTPMDEEVRREIQREAINVGIGTAISPYGFIDAVITLWRNARLVRRVAGVYRVRAGAWGTLLILRRTLVAVATADLAQEAATALLGTLRGLPRLISPFTQGATNAALTVRVGIMAQQQCRPLPLRRDKAMGTVGLLGRSVAHAVRRAVGGKPDGEVNEAADH